MPALQSLTTPQVGADKQGQLQGVLASLVSLASIFGPLFFSFVYFAITATWPGLIWIIGAGDLPAGTTPDARYQRSRSVPAAGE